jgi:2,5-diamino-6-(ribosylamino)-4(3H)-pyrimidinone 5'-phosphate reductase
VTGKILRLYPLPHQELEAGTLYESLELPPTERDDLPRPYVVINMASSIDGRAAIGGKASLLGSETDRGAMRTLRSKADAVMIGANTLRAEKLSLGLDEFSSGPQPVAIIVTTIGDVPLETNLIATKQQEVLVVIAQDTSERRVTRLREHASVLRVSASPSGGVDLQETLEALRIERGIELVLVEGGPRLNHSLISANLADELFLTLAPKMLGGTSDPTILDSQAVAPIDVNLVSVHLASSELYLRYTLS